MIVRNVQPFLLHGHLYSAPKQRKTQHLIKTDFLEGNHVLQN